MKLYGKNYMEIILWIYNIIETPLYGKKLPVSQKLGILSKFITILNINITGPRLFAFK